MEKESSSKATKKVILVGDDKVGKTSLLYRFNEKKFDADIRPTVVMNLTNFTYTKDDKVLDVKFYDTAGQEKYKSLSKIFFLGSALAICVFDVCQQSSFESIKEWIQLVHQYSPHAIIYVVGNKKDLEGELPHVSKYEALNFAKNINACFFFTSAKTGENVDNLFNKIISDLWEQLLNTVDQIPQQNGVDIAQSSNPARQNSCCS